ncbi:hypothetical protein Apa02nite_065960 [Actinoplanes palleronii]|uniref:Secreted protein n=1 Tax=Actinoplanes palleronii TaxID=113570 RepID=A0ABQ4BIJ3_9ACTN|nr:hypothetical protein Apa02nite_065960 [Actinoplanes palleronii]
MVPCAHATTLFFFPVFGVSTRPVDVVMLPVMDVVTYWTRFPVASADSSAGRVAAVLVRTVPDARAADAG